MYKLILAFCVLSILLIGCKEDPPFKASCDYLEINEDDAVLGFNILEKLPSIWNGPVSSSTALGSYSEWVVDFRPIAVNNVAAKNELDDLNDIFMSFFIVKHDCQNKIAFRNGGSFAGLNRNSYMLVDSVFESNTLSYYRFSDPVSSGDRVYSDVIFKADSLIIEVYTNKYNTLSEPVSHMKWEAKRMDVTSSEEAVANFNFPQKELAIDFTNTFNGLSEAVFYSIAQDPFPEDAQPYLGESTVSVSIVNPSVVDNTKKVFILITTEKLFNGFVFNAGNLDFRTRYVLLDASSLVDFTFNYMHPGNYYINTLYDANGDQQFSSGDYMNSSFDKPFTLTPEGNTSVSIDIDFQIP